MDLGVSETSDDVSNDVSMDTSKNECLICITECDTLSSDLFLYNCTCTYYVHKRCMIDWRRIAKTDRICLICPITIEDDKELRVIPYRPVALLANNEELRINNRDRIFIGTLIRFIFLPFTGFTVIAGVILILAFILEKIFKVQIRNR
jgi:hypothetical protein